MDYNDKLAQMKKEKLRLERCSLRGSVSENLRYLYDYSLLMEAFKVLEEDFKDEYYVKKKTSENYEKQVKNNRYNDIVFNKEYMHQGNDMYEVLTRCSNLFKNNDFYSFRNKSAINIKKSERNEIICSYLDYLIPNGSSLYLKLLEKFSCLTGVNLPGENLANTFCLYSKPEDSIILIDSYLKGYDIYYMLLIIHEIMHYYSGIIVADYGNANLNSIIFGNLPEVLSVYSEFSFMDWLKKNRIYANNVEFINNYVLSNNYIFIERIRYYYFCLKNNVKVSIDNDRIINIPKNDLNFDSYYSSDFLGLNDGIDIVDFRYILAFLKTFDLLELEASGENMDRVIRDFIANIRDKTQETRIILNEKNDEAIGRHIRENTEACKRLYRYK